MEMDPKDHWDRIYSTTRSDDLSWFQTEPSTSLRLLDAIGLSTST